MTAWLQKFNSIFPVRMYFFIELIKKYRKVLIFLLENFTKTLYIIRLREFFEFLNNLFSVKFDFLERLLIVYRSINYRMANAIQITNNICT